MLPGGGDVGAEVFDHPQRPGQQRVHSGRCGAGCLVRQRVAGAAGDGPAAGAAERVGADPGRGGQVGAVGPQPADRRQQAGLTSGGLGQRQHMVAVGVQVAGGEAGQRGEVALLQPGGEGAQVFQPAYDGGDRRAVGGAGREHRRVLGEGLGQRGQREGLQRQHEPVGEPAPDDVAGGGVRGGVRGGQRPDLIGEPHGLRVGAGAQRPAREHRDVRRRPTVPVGRPARRRSGQRRGRVHRRSQSPASTWPARRRWPLVTAGRAWSSSPLV